MVLNLFKFSFKVKSIMMLKLKLKMKTKNAIITFVSLTVLNIPLSKRKSIKYTSKLITITMQLLKPHDRSSIKLLIIQKAIDLSSEYKGSHKFKFSD